MKEIIPSKQYTEDMVVSRRRAEPVASEVFKRAVDEACAGVRQDNAEMRQRHLRAYAMGGIILD